MFDPSQFCHIASNARNRQKIAVFLYRNDGHDTPTVPGFFDSKATELNKGDMIIVTKPPVSPYFNLEYNLYQVVEKTVDTVGVRQINSSPENQLLVIKANKTTDFESPITATNKGATMAQINALIEQLTGVQTDLTDLINTKATKATDFVTPVTASNKGITQTEQSTLEASIDRAATSGKIIGSYWFGKTTTAAAPNPTMSAQNYFDFTTNTPYKAKADLSGWDAQAAIVPPGNIDAQILITSKFWDIPEQAGQQGGKAFWSHTESDWAYYPTIVSFESPALSGVPTTSNLTSSSPQNQIANKAYVDNALNTSTLLAALYPVGAIYITANDSSSCPLATLIPGSAWNRVAQGCALWGASGTQGAGQKLAAGLPDIQGWFGAPVNQDAQLISVGGAFSQSGIHVEPHSSYDTYGGAANERVDFKASDSNPIYGNSATVQPPAYTIWVWQRTA